MPIKIKRKKMTDVTRYARNNDTSQAHPQAQEDTTMDNVARRPDKSDDSESDNELTTQNVLDQHEPKGSKWHADEREELAILDVNGPEQDNRLDDGNIETYVFDLDRLPYATTFWTDEVEHAPDEQRAYHKRHQVAREQDPSVGALSTTFKPEEILKMHKEIDYQSANDGPRKIAARLTNYEKNLNVCTAATSYAIMLSKKENERVMNKLENLAMDAAALMNALSEPVRAFDRFNDLVEARLVMHLNQNRCTIPKGIGEVNKQKANEDDTDEEPEGDTENYYSKKRKAK